MVVIERACVASAAEVFRPLAMQPGAFLLDSVRPAGPAARWAVFGAFPRKWFVAQAGDRAAAAGLARELAALPDPTRSAAGFPAGLARLPFAGGWVGYLAYDVAHWFEDLPRRAVDDLGLPDAALALIDTFACLDLEHGRLSLVSLGLDVDRGRLDPRLAEERVRELEQALDGEATSGAFASGPEPVTARLTAGPDPVRFEAMVRRALDYIAAGDVFQVNLAQRLVIEIAGDPFALYRRLAGVSPAPFAAWLHWPGVTVISASPERLVHVGPEEPGGRRVETRPIAGTHPRLPDPDEDRRMVERLSRDPKERAEHVMMVDLERNDLGRVARFGTVRVSDLLRVESYSHVHHLVSTVEARLTDAAGPLDVLRAVFPGGTITGAPKVRAMQIIDELEPVRRGLYTGSVGFIGLDGRMDWNIVIRTLQVIGDRAHVYVGAGIVADSEPAREHRETLHKARGLLAALGLSEVAGGPGWTGAP